MRFRFMLVPAAIVASTQAHAEKYMSFEQAQEALFPGAAFTPAFHALSDAEMEAIIAESNATVWNRKVKVWKVSTGGWIFYDEVLGRDDWISYAVGVDAVGVVTGVEILECLERYDQI